MKTNGGAGVVAGSSVIARSEVVNNQACCLAIRTWRDAETTGCIIEKRRKFVQGKSHKTSNEKEANHLCVEENVQRCNFQTWKLSPARDLDEVWSPPGVHILARFSSRQSTTQTSVLFMIAPCHSLQLTDLAKSILCCKYPDSVISIPVSQSPRKLEQPQIPGVLQISRSISLTTQ